MIYFSIPDFLENYELNKKVITLWKESPEKFYDDISIDNVYGSFPCIWNGGRYINGVILDKGNMSQIIKSFNDLGVGVRFTFTNLLIEEKDLKDITGNMILSLGENELNSVTVSTEVMKNYIEKNYPKYSVLWSTTLCEENIDKINELNKNNVLILNYTLNNNFDKLNKLKNRNNIEVLCNELCKDNCPFRKQHYIEISEYNLKYTTERSGCRFPQGPSNYYDLTKINKSTVSIENIRENYLPLGINKFKLSGRNETFINLIERYINYLVKPEWRDWVRMELLTSLFS